MASVDGEQRPVRRRALLGGIALAGVIGLGIAGARAAAHLRGVDTPSAEPAQERGLPDGPASPEEAAQLEAFVRSVVTDIEAMWTRVFQRRSTRYVPAQLVLVDVPAKADCGPGLELGRPECLGVNESYIDLSFLRGLDARFGDEAHGAKVYAIAHELGHHVQRVLGLDRKLESLLLEKPVARHWTTIQMELQADCLAGVWIRRAEPQHLVGPTQIEASIRHTSDLGMERHRALPRDAEPLGENFTYAIPRRRIYWFAQGYAHGELDDCDTFAP